MLGRFASDGTLGRTSVQWLCAEREFDVRDYLLEILNRVWDVKVYRRKDTVVDRLVVHSVELTEDFDELDLKIRVPDLAGPALLGYLAGMFDGDGSMAEGVPTLSMGPAKGILAEQIEFALLSLGIECSRYSYSKEHKIRVRKSHLGEFKRQVGFLSARKVEALS